ncbi:hypothetical protein U1Q18_044817 [Sarracenia purpurea var. burkii]
MAPIPSSRNLVYLLCVRRMPSFRIVFPVVRPFRTCSVRTPEYLDCRATDASDTSEPVVPAQRESGGLGPQHNDVNRIRRGGKRPLGLQVTRALSTVDLSRLPQPCSTAVSHLVRADRMTGRTGRPRATRQIDLQVIDQVDGLRAAVNEMASFLRSEELGDLAARAAVLFAATLSALQQASVTVESGLREVKMSSGEFRSKVNYNADLQSNSYSCKKIVIQVVSVPHSSLNTGALAARETTPAAAILRQHLELQFRRGEQPLPFQSAKSKELQVAVKPGTPISFKGKNTRSVFCDRLRSVETAEKLAERGRVTVIESYYALAQAYLQINHHYAVTKLSLDHQQFHSVTFHHLRAPAFKDTASQKTTRSAAAPDIPNNAKNLAALKKRLERAREIGALAELFGLQTVSGSRLTTERVDQIAFSLIRTAGAGQKRTEIARFKQMESDHDMHESARQLLLHRFAYSMTFLLLIFLNIKH